MVISFFFLYMKINRAETEFSEFTFNNTEGCNVNDHNVRLRGQLINKMEKYKYLG